MIEVLQHVHMLDVDLRLRGTSAQPAPHWNHVLATSCNHAKQPLAKQACTGSAGMSSVLGLCLRHVNPGVASSESVTMAQCCQPSQSFIGAGQCLTCVYVGMLQAEPGGRQHAKTSGAPCACQQPRPQRSSPSHAYGTQHSIHTTVSTEPTRWARRGGLSYPPL